MFIFSLLYQNTLISEIIRTLEHIEIENYNKCVFFTFEDHGNHSSLC
jgi:hypothetical protein